MKRSSFIKHVASAAVLSFSTLSCATAKTDFNEVGKQMLITLRNNHYETFEFNAKLGDRFFNSYLNSLDSNKQFFLASDVDELRKKYGSNLHALLITGNSMPAATEIHEVFYARLKARIDNVKKQLADEASFSFESDREAVISREDAEWFTTSAQADEFWKGQVEQALLGEVLKRDTIAKLAQEQGKENPLDGKDSPGQLIADRYERVLKAKTDLTEEEIADSFFGAIASSYDPHTDYLSSSQMDRFMSSMQNSFVGIGAMLSSEDDGSTKITGIIKGGPAYLGGDLKINDRIVGIDTNNEGSEEAMADVVFEEISKVVDLIRGKKGSSVRFKIEPANGAPGEVSYIVIDRGVVELVDSLATGELINMKDAEGKERRLGYIKLPSFYADFKNYATGCALDIKKLVTRLDAEKAEGIVIDLRGNGGGSLEEVRKMTGFFTGSGPVVQVKSHTGQVQVKNSDPRDPIYDGAIVVLIDKTSASASEILAGALQDYGRAVVVGGSSTFGKGTVQQIMRLANKMPFMSDARRAGTLKPTIQKFYRVSGSTTQLEGVKSDIVLPSVLEAFEIGEGYLDHALPHDNINAAADFNPARKRNLFLPQLSKLSSDRVAASQDFTYISEDATRMTERRVENTMSLNLKKRSKEIEESEARKNLRNKERLTRFATMADRDKDTFRFYRLTLEDVEAKELVELNRKKDVDEYMISAEDKVADLDETPDWPSDLDPVKRESIYILTDLLKLTEQAGVTGALKADAR